MRGSSGLGDRPTERNGNESQEQPAFWRTHKARETARASRVKAQRDKDDKKSNGSKK